MDDTFRLDLSGYDKEYVEEVLDGFLEGAGKRGRRLAEIRISKAMLEKLGLGQNKAGSFYRGVPVVVSDTGFDETVEVTLAPIQ